MPRTRRLRASVSACITGSLLLVTVACTSDSATPDTAPTTPSSVVPTEAPPPTTEPPTAQPPALPAEAQEDTVAGASAFARHYWAVANYGTKTGDVSPLRALGTSDCSACADIEAGITRIYDRQQTLNGGLTEVQDVSPRPGDPVAGLVTKVLLRQSGGSVADVDGETTSTFAATEPFLIDMVLVWREDAWLVNEWGSSSAS